MVICYDPNGNPVEKEPVDARECCATCGFTMSPPDKAVEMKNDQVSKTAEMARVFHEDKSTEDARVTKRGKASKVLAEES